MNEAERKQRKAETQAQDREAESIRLKAALRQKDEYVRLQQRIDALQAGLEALSRQVRDLQEGIADCPGRAAAKWRITKAVVRRGSLPREEATCEEATD